MTVGSTRSKARTRRPPSDLLPLSLRPSLDLSRTLHLLFFLLFCSTRARGLGLFARARFLVPLCIHVHAFFPFHSFISQSRGGGHQVKSASACTRSWTRARSSATWASSSARCSATRAPPRAAHRQCRGARQHRSTAARRAYAVILPALYAETTVKEELKRIVDYAVFQLELVDGSWTCAAAAGGGDWSSTGGTGRGPILADL